MSHANRPIDTADNSYQTGKTRPPVRHSGLLTVFLTAVILLIGITRTMGFLNLQVLERLSLQQDTYADFADLVNTAGSPYGDSGSSLEPVFSDEKLQLADSPESVETIPQGGGLSLQQIYEKNIASVVSVTCETPGGTASGTGVVFSANGYIVTNSHVVENAEEIEVLLTSGERLKASIVGTDPMTDLAVLYVGSTALSPAEFGDSSVLRVGDLAVAIGAPFGSALRGTMTDGIVSAINRNLTTGGRTMTLIQTNAALTAGNSGGPLLNGYGQVVGIHTLKIAGSTEGLGFAIPSTTVKEVVDQLICRGYVSGRPSFGFAAKEVDPFYQVYCNYPQGLYIVQTEGAKKGLQTGDILLSLNTCPITSVAQLTEFLCSCQPGDTVSAKIYRGGKQITLTLVVEAM